MASNEQGGVWRTIGGRRVFIKDGQSLSEAMIESGKFKNLRSDYRKAKEEEKGIKLSEKQIEAGNKLNENAEKGVREDIKSFLSGKEDYDGSKEDFIRDLSDNWGVDKDKVEKILNEERSKSPRNFKEDRPQREIHKLGQTNSSDETIDLDKIQEDKERLEIAKDIAKELYGKGMGEERLEREARSLLEYNEGEVLEKGETPYENTKGELERSTEYLKQWRDQLKGGKEEKTEPSIKQSDNVVKLPDGTPIDQNYIKDLYSGMSYEEVKRENDFDKEWIKDVKPEARPTQEAKIRETEKYLQNMERYESRIDDKEFGKKDWGDNVYPFSEGTAWKGTKSDQNLSTTEVAKEVIDKMKEAYPDIKINRKTSYYSGGSSADFSIMESDKPLIRSIDDFSQTELNRLYNRGYNSNYYKNVDEFKEALGKRLASGNIDVNKYHIDENYELTPYGKTVLKDLNKVIDAYNYDESDSMTDYFHTGFYSDISIGKYNKPYQVKESKSSKSASGNQITNSLQQKAYQKYLKEHPNSKMTYDEFLKK